MEKQVFDPLLIFQQVLNSEIKWLIVIILQNEAALTFLELLVIIGINKERLQTMLWEMEKERIIKREIRGRTYYFELTSLGQSAWEIGNRIEKWWHHQHTY
ncbi:hypothetical protein A5819_003625 [Enterococcus sp. 7E2_DIV0204]|uniref:hypothetical protein n=1 Tax=unclassified Enterococcus TaxID=2608891 RepID=UPI000B6A46E4|nr:MULTISPECIES: hypothetical protein [unclassified Enterococcus]OTN83806.1 hypothetical protein A5819_003625 [Enterococcus sp. 7E2_DIV0204]OTP47542.1 hypothetical protein A5884_003513 [Enterococcus sp. 7D2_DIV0200]